MLRLLLIVIVCVLPGIVSAHASMASLYATSGPYLIDVGYDPEEPQVGRRFLIDISLRDGGETAPEVEYDSVWVRMSRDRATYLATGVADSSMGPTTMVLTLPEESEGQMTLSLRFEKDGETLAEDSFTLPVAPRERSFFDYWYMIGAASFIVGLVLALIGVRVKRYTQGG
jgi:hypothetical protein